MTDVIAFELAHAHVELNWFLQEWFDFSEADPFDTATYDAALAHERKLGGADGIDGTLQANNLDALVAPTGSPAWTTERRRRRGRRARRRSRRRPARTASPGASRRGDRSHHVKEPRRRTGLFP
jgi:hypothetical protein